MSEFVRDDELGLGLRKCADQRIAEHDPVRLADPRYEGICFTGLTAHVHSENRRIADAEAFGERAETRFERSGNWFELVEERHDVEGHDNVADHKERKGARARPERPLPWRPAKREAEQR